MAASSSVPARRDFLKLSGGAALGLLAGSAQRAQGKGRPAPVPRSPRRDAAGDRGGMTLFLCGDVMTGRGIDQILPHPSDPILYESYVQSAVGYLRLAERASGPIPRPVTPSYIWGDALEELERADPDLRIINLETSVTTSDEPAPKGIHYRMHPKNAACLTAAGIDCCVLANNHVLDWGRKGLVETLETLRKIGVQGAGAGHNAEEAAAPAVLAAGEKGRLLLYAFGSPTSGVPREWAATAKRPGVNVLEELSERTLRRIADRIAKVKRPNDVVVASIHWGGNWGYRIPPAQRRFAHGLIEGAAVDVVYGHSSHHAKGIEVWRGRPILYGCGDFLNDYEGIRGYEEFRDDLTLMYFLRLDPATGRLLGLEMAPMRIRRMRLQRAAEEEARWLRATLDREGDDLGTAVDLTGAGRLALRWS